MTRNCKRMSGYIKVSSFQIEEIDGITTASFLLEWHSPKQRHPDHATRVYTEDIITAQEAINHHKRVYITAVEKDDRYVTHIV